MRLLLGAIGVLVCIVGLVGCALLIRLGLARRDWVLIIGALVGIVAFVNAVLWMGEAL